MGGAANWMGHGLRESPGWSKQHCDRGSPSIGTLTPASMSVGEKDAPEFLVSVPDIQFLLIYVCPAEPCSGAGAQRKQDLISSVHVLAAL